MSATKEKSRDREKSDGVVHLRVRTLNRFFFKRRPITIAQRSIATLMYILEAKVERINIDEPRKALNLFFLFELTPLKPPKEFQPCVRVGLLSRNRR